MWLNEGSVSVIAWSDSRRERLASNFRRLLLRSTKVSDVTDSTGAGTSATSRTEAGLSSAEPMSLWSCPTSALSSGIRGSEIRFDPGFSVMS